MCMQRVQVILPFAHFTKLVWNKTVAKISLKIHVVFKRKSCSIQLCLVLACSNRIIFYLPHTFLWYTSAIELKNVIEPWVLRKRNWSNLGIFFFSPFCCWLFNLKKKSSSKLVRNKVEASTILIIDKLTMESLTEVKIFR